MGRRDENPELVQRLERVLALAEPILAELAALAPEPQEFDRCLAFRWDVRRGPGRLVAIEQPQTFDLGDLIGVDRSVTRLVENTAQFVAGHPSNHVLLHGERGTGKSSSVRGLLGRFGDVGLRLVEVHKADLLHLPAVLESLRGVPYRFVLYCDDLSFDSDEPEYRELKAALEGSLAAPPANVRIYATSNRRNLLPERLADNRDVRLDEDGEVQLGEAIDEKLALSERFGLVLGFYGFDQATYLDIVRHYADQLGVGAPWVEVREKSLAWALRRSSRSGRTARQFVDDFAGREALAAEPTAGA